MTVQTVTGPVPATELGLVLPHEHLFNDLSGVLDRASHGFSEYLADQPVHPSIAWALRQDPYCCADNLAPKPVEDVLGELATFQRLGGRTLVDATGSTAIGRNPERLRETAERTGLNLVMGCGTYLEKFEGTRITGAGVDAQAAAIRDELTHGVGQHRVKPGIIGEIGISPDCTEPELAALRAAALAQLDHPRVPLMIHLPGWQRRAHDLLDIVLGQVGVEPERVVLAHLDPSADDPDYQRAIAERGVWLEFDMIGMDVAFPHEGAAPNPATTATAVTRLHNTGHTGQILLSHDLFLKQMWTRNGGNGLAYVPAVFAETLVAHGLEHDEVDRLTHRNPVLMLAGDPAA